MSVFGRRKRKAFSLAEILVAVAIVAVVAAVVIPTIAGQVNKADPQAVGNAAAAVRGAVEQFLSDVRRYPASFSQLQKVPTGKVGLIGGNYSTTETARWAGPYLQKDSVSALATGWDLNFDPNFAVDTLGTSGLLETTATDPKYLTLCLALDQTKALLVDKMFDDGVLTTGSIRWTTQNAGLGRPDSLKILILPIQ